MQEQSKEIKELNEKDLENKNLIEIQKKEIENLKKKDLEKQLEIEALKKQQKGIIEE